MKIIIFFISLAYLTISCKKESQSESIADPITGPDTTTVVPIKEDSRINPYYISDSLGKQIQFFNEHPSGTSEKNRLGLTYTPSDFLPTGLTANINDIITLTVDITAGSNLPTLLIGTYYRYGVSYQPQAVQLKEGENNIVANKKGILWIRYGTGNTPSSSVKITFNKGTKVVPTFIKNRTSLTYFQNSVQNSDTSVKDILLIGQNTYTVLKKEIKSYNTQDNNILIQQLDDAWSKEEEFSGLDGSSELNKRLLIPHLLTICEPGYAGAFAFHYGTGYSYDNYFYTTDKSNISVPRHEFGHMHQQGWDWYAEIIADIYAVSCGINQGLDNNTIARDGAWLGIWERVSTYLNQPAELKDYSKIWGNGDIQTVRYLGSAMAIQLKFAYGDSLFRQFHKITRIEKPVLSSAAEKHQYFMKKMCIISGKDLTVFFKNWGFNYPSTYAEIEKLNLPKPSIEPSTITSAQIVN